ncbi:mitogen-activated protein kinase kinase kinase [Paecilomyces lecythidis]
MDGQRQPYIPVPPPPAISQQPQSHVIPLPPPPPRPPTQAHGIPPPPPGPPPGSSYGVAPGWQQSWGRPAVHQGLPPPPPHPPMLNQQHQHIAYGRQPAPLSVPPPPPQSDQPLTSATYIPAGESFGPGVGIPPLFDSYTRSAYEGQDENTLTPSTRHMPSSHILHDTVHELVSPNVPANSAQNIPAQSTGQAPGLSKSSSHRHNNSSASLGGLSPSEAAVQWPLDRVLAWLSQNGFSNDWQETFKSLELQGADFLELGHGANGRGNLGKMHNVVYPQLAKECQRSGTGWDQIRERREREEGKRMRKLIRNIHDDGSRETTHVSLQKRRSSQPLSASPLFDAGVDSSPNLAGSAVSSGNPESPVNYTAKNKLGEYSRRHSAQLRSVTLPVPGPTSHDSHASEFHPSDTATLYPRSELSRSALKGLSEHRRQSSSTASDTGPFPAPPLRPYEESPKSGSPAAQNATLVPSGLTSSSTGDLSYKSEHSRGNSTDSAFGGSSHGPNKDGPTRYYEARRQGLDTIRPSPQDTAPRQWNGESASFSKDSSKGFLNIFKKRTKPTDSSHPSPEEQSLESPTSPVNTRQNGSYLPFTKPGLNTSDVSLGERPSSASFSDHEKAAIRIKPASKGKKYIFVTADGWNYRLVDVTDVDSADALRSAICQNLGVSDWINAQIFPTEPGQTDHEEPLNDHTLVLSRRIKSDALGTMKVFVRAANPHSTSTHSPRFAGLGVSMPEKNTMSPISGPHHLQRKPLDEEAMLRVSAAGVSPIDAPREPKQTPESDNHDFPPRSAETDRRLKPSHYGETGYRREGVIDFDRPRPSPFEDKRVDNLIPQRKAPSAPSESHTLTKVNSISKKPGQRSPIAHPDQNKQKAGVLAPEELADGRKPISPAHGLGHGLAAAVASVGKMTSAIGTPSPSVPSQSKLVQSPEHNFTGPSRTSPVMTTPKSAVSNNSREQSRMEAPPVPSEQPRRPTPKARKSYGPEFDFEETKVSFQQPSSSQDNEDEDSDDGLFAKPLTARKQQSDGNQSGPPSPETEKKSARPSLTLNTETKPGKGLTVSFKSPTVHGDFSTGPSTRSPSGESSDSKAHQSSTAANSSSHSPADQKASRRSSFARDDVWASRPPVEGVIENLDDYFPDIDLDEPYLGPASPPASPVATPIRGAAEEQSHGAGPSQGAAPPQPAEPPGREASDSFSFGESAITATKSTSGRSRGNAGRSGGLGRMKSIREVAKGAHQVHRNRSVASSNNAPPGTILRRKSTKMFGAKIMQISPKPGARISQLDPIPQNSVPHGNIPQRQPTFRIVRGQLIGKGTYGRVYLGINADTGELLAVKQVEINPKLAGQDKDRIKEMVAAMDQEIDTMQHLEHPNIVQYLGCERGEFSISIYLEYISGGSIGSCLRKHGKFEESVVKSLTRQTLDGLAYLHDQGILHRDLKADNILLDLDGSCKISDFGISKKTDNIYGNDASNSMQGSVFWMAPEVVQSKGQGYSAKVDIWSLGCVVLEMFAGRRPWSKEEAIGAIFKLGSLNQAPPIPEDVSMNISPAALAFMYDCFTVDSAERPTAQTLLSQHPFCEPDPYYNFVNTELYAKIRHVL